MAAIGRVGGMRKLEGRASFVVEEAVGGVRGRMGGGEEKVVEWAETLRW